MDVVWNMQALSGSSVPVIAEPLGLAQNIIWNTFAGSHTFILRGQKTTYTCMARFSDEIRPRDTSFIICAMLLAMHYSGVTFAVPWQPKARTVWSQFDMMHRSSFHVPDLGQEKYQASPSKDGHRSQTTKAMMPTLS